MLNTCCIRENADNKLYGHLGRLKALKAASVPTCRSRSAAAWPRRTASSIVERAGARRRRVRHPQPRQRAGAARAGPVRGPGRRDPRGARGVPVGAAGPARRRRTRRGSPSRSAATTRAPSASCPSCAGPRSAAAWATSSTRSRSSPPTACARSRCSARTSTPTAATSAPGSTGRSSPTSCARSTRSTASSASASRRRTRRTCAPRRSRRWPSARRCASTCTCRCSRGATARWPACTAATPPTRYLRAPGRRPAPRSPDLAVTTDIIVGFPGETDDDFERTLEVVDEAAYDAAYTFVFSPRPGTRAADMVDDFVAPEVAQERMSRLTEVVERHALAKHEARVGRTEEVLRRGPVEERRHRCGRVAPARTSSCTSRPSGTSRWSGGTADVAVTDAAPALAPRRPRRVVDPAPRPVARPHPRHRRACVTRPHLAIVGPTASGKSALALEVARAFGDVEIVSLDSMQVYRGLDIGTAKPTVGRAGRGRAPPDRRRRSRRGVVGRAVPAGGARRGRRHRGARPARAARRRHRALRAGGRRPARPSRPRTAPSRDADPRPATDDAYAELTAARPGGRGRASSPATRAGSPARSR